MTRAGVLPAAPIGRELVVLHAGAVLRHPRGLGADVGMVQRPLQVAGIGIDTEVRVTAGLEGGVPLVGNAVVNVRVGGRGMPGPRPLFKVVVHRILQVAGAHAELPKLGDHILAFPGGPIGVIRVGIPVDAEGDAESLAFGDVALRLGIGRVVGSIAKTDDRAFHAIGLRLGPIDVTLPLGDINHALGLLHEQVVLVIEESLRTVIGAPMRAVTVAFKSGRPDPGIIHVRIRYGLLDILGADRNERFAVRFGQRIRLLILRADQCRIGHRFTCLEVLDGSIRRGGELLRDHGGIIRDLRAHCIRKLRIRIIRHALPRVLFIVRLHG